MIQMMANSSMIQIIGHVESMDVKSVVFIQQAILFVQSVLQDLHYMEMDAHVCLLLSLFINECFVLLRCVHSRLSCIM